jgi:aspartate 1-decarboxylase
MLISMCMAKLHRVTVTQADLNYVGSITIDEALLEASGVQEYQYVNITNVSNAAFWRTYVLAGERGSGVICLNGPPARLFQPGDKIIVLAEAWVDPAELREGKLKTAVVFVDDDNRITSVKRHDDIAVGAGR